MCATQQILEEGASRVPIRTLRVVVVDGPQAGVEVGADDDAPLQVGSAEGNHLVLRDETVSRYHLELSRAATGILVCDQGSTNGTYAGALQIERALVPPETELRVGRRRIRVLDGDLVSVPLHSPHLGALRGSHPSMRRLFARISKAAESDVPVLLVGESGTGKELLARALHDGSRRADRPFIIVDCASLAPTLVASELFGHERGAFTGAERRREGAFERAHGGTLFLDEVGELPEQLQPMLLGVLERRRFRRLGGADEIDVDLRVVAATNRDLRAEVNAARFRLDLYFRLAVVRVEVPALRERASDLPFLVEHFLQETGTDQAIEEVFPREVLASLMQHHWPGNVRELRNYVAATVAMGERLPLEGTETAAAPESSVDNISLPPTLQRPYKDARASVLQQFERYYLEGALARAGGNVAQAARDCDIDRSHLWELVRKHGLR